MTNGKGLFLQCLPLALLLATGALPFTANAESACDPLIKQNLEHPQGYRERSDQLCEGVYATEVASHGLTLASFTGPLNSLDLTAPADINFVWNAPGAGEVRIRADSLRPRFYYRMDAVRPATDGRLSWNNGIPSLYKLRTREFGVLATLRDPSRSTPGLVYLPLRLSTDQQGTPATPYIVTVISGAEIEEIYWSLNREGAEGFIAYDEALGRQPYAAGQPIDIELDHLEGLGMYHLTVSAELRGGLHDSFEMSFLHAE